MDFQSIKTNTKKILFKKIDYITNEINTLALSPDGKILASGSWANTIKLWKLSYIEEDGKVDTREICDKMKKLKIE